MTDFDDESIRVTGPLKQLGSRLADLLDADQWNNIEPLLIACSEQIRQATSDIFQRPSDYDQIALEATRQIALLPADLHPSQRTARTQLIVLKAMCHDPSITKQP